MPRRRAALLSPRKRPRQARSEHLVEAILQAAVRVLEREGAGALTTKRVAERAGVSVGSLYQYFPNKESILFRLQEREWATTGRLLDDIFSDVSRSAPERLRAAMRAFFHTECDEAPLRRALGDAAALYREAQHGQEQKVRGMPRVRKLVREVAPRLSPKAVAFAAELYVATFVSLGEFVSEADGSRAEVDRWANAAADMFLAYLQSVS